MLAALTQILLFQLAGETIAHGLSLPVPGPVLGMVLLFLFLVLRQGPDPDLQQTSQNLLQHLSLLFLPAGTGVMLHLHRLQEEWLPIVLSLVLSTAVTLALTGLLLKALSQSRRPAAESGEARP